MAYIDNYGFKYTDALGNVKQSRRGDPLPEAKDWPTLGNHVRRGRIIITGDEDGQERRAANKRSVNLKQKIEAHFKKEEKKEEQQLELPLEEVQEGKLTKAVLSKLSRKELNEKAKQAGIADPDVYSSKGDLIEELLAD